MPSTDVTRLTAHSGISLLHNCTKIQYLLYSCHMTPQSRTDMDKTQLTGTVRGPARRPHFSLAIISVTV